MQYSIGVPCPLNCQNEYVETPIGLCLIFFGASLLLGLIFEQPTNGAPIDAVTSDFSIDLLSCRIIYFFI